MSEAIKVSIAGRLTLDVPLVALVGIDPNDGVSPAMFAAYKNDAPPVPQCLTYRLHDDKPVAAFEPANADEAALAASAPVLDFTLELEYWTLSPDSAPVEAARARLDVLFNATAWDVEGEGRVFISRRQVASCDNRDPKTNLRFGVFRYRLRFQTS